MIKIIGANYANIIKLCLISHIMLFHAFMLKFFREKYSFQIYYPSTSKYVGNQYV